MDAFFASVEQRDNPDLRGKPIVVGGSGRRGVVAAASYEARKYGVHSAMPGAKAIRLCPELIFVPHRFDAYKEASRIIRNIFKEVTPHVEPLSLDEAYLDVSHHDLTWDGAISIALDVKKRILHQTQLTSTAGISYNKFLAKIASGLDKPDGLTLIHPDQAESFLEELPIEEFFGVGKVTAARLKDHGIHKGADLKAFSEVQLATRYGKMGRYLFKVVRGEDDRQVKAHRERKSLSVERTFTNDIDTKEELDKSLKKICEELSNRLTKSNIEGSTIVLKVRFRDFTTLTRQTKLEQFSTASDFLMEKAYYLLSQLGNLDPIRLLGLGITDLKKEESDPQLKLDI